MHDQFVAEDLDERHVINSSGVDAEQTAHEIAARRLAGSLRL